MSLIYEFDCQSREDVSSEYSALVRACYDKLFGKLLEDEGDNSVSSEPDRAPVSPLRKKKAPIARGL